MRICRPTGHRASPLPGSIPGGQRGVPQPHGRDACAAALLRLDPARPRVSIKELAEYLAHSDPGFTLRTHTHLVPSSYERARVAIDGVFGLESADGLAAA